MIFEHEHFRKQFFHDGDKRICILKPFRDGQHTSVWLKTSPCTKYRGNISARFSGSAEASASEFLEYLEEIFIHY